MKSYGLYLALLITKYYIILHYIILYYIILYYIILYYIILYYIILYYIILYYIILYYIILYYIILSSSIVISIQNGTHLPFSFSMEFVSFALLSSVLFVSTNKGFILDRLLG